MCIDQEIVKRVDIYRQKNYAVEDACMLTVKKLRLPYSWRTVKNIYYKSRKPVNKVMVIVISR